MKSSNKIITDNSLFVVTMLFVFFLQITGAQTFQDNLSGEIQGDFPSRWDLAKGSAEIATLGGDKIIYLANESVITPIIMVIII